MDVAASVTFGHYYLEVKINAFAIDLNIPEEYQKFEYYIQMDATETSFNEDTFSGISLQYSYEMFLFEDDRNLIREAARILKKGGKLVISPVYAN
ncbi:methyltransferase domain-containing protein [Bacillus salitolerans]|uniref:Methyltransferase domain-containing protein n=1 Tax=Bacillus salitolerans TaxID=1437434 RepID=A0ABW4LP66_9BACI